MAGIDQLPSGKHRVRWRVGKQRYTRTFDTQSEAKAFAATVDGNPTPPAPSSPRYDQWVAGWFGDYASTVKPSTAERYKKVLNLYVIPHFGFLPLDEITPAVARSWQSQLLASGLSPATVKLARTVANIGFRDAVVDELLPASPFTRVKSVRVPKHKIRILNEEEVVLLADSIKPRWRTLVLVAAYCGLRIGELAALRVRDLNLATHQITISETRTKANGTWTEGPAKTENSQRTIQVPKFVMVELEEHFARGYASDTRIFTGTRGGALQPDHFRKFPWAKALRDSGLGPLRVHDLRHTAVSLWIREGASPNLIAYRAGHGSVQYVLDTYGHLFGDEDEELAARLDAGRPPMSPFRRAGSQPASSDEGPEPEHLVELI